MMIRTDDANYTVPSLATAALKAIIEADKAVPNSPTGWPSYKGNDIDAVKWGMVLQDIIWSSDRGNWMWDGVLATLRALGVDTATAL